MGDEGLPKNPDLAIAQLLFSLNQAEQSGTDRQTIIDSLLSTFKEHNMAPLYKLMCEQIKTQPNASLLREMKSVNEAEIKKLDEAVADATTNSGESEVRDALLRKAEYLCKIGDKEQTIEAFKLVEAKSASFGQRLDVQFYLIRLGLFFMDHDVITSSMTKAKKLMDEGGDWDRRNRLKVYQGYYAMCVRDFKLATAMFLDGLATFTSTELMSYKQFIAYAVVVSMLTLNRVDLIAKIVQSPEIKEALHDLPIIRQYLSSLYECNYRQFFSSLATIESELKADRMLSAHYKYYTREMRILAYSQLLESYKSVTLESVASSFGVSVDYIDKELSGLIAAGRLHCKIDKVSGVIETNRPDSKNAQYQTMIKQGDLLLNRVQKLSRVINV